MKPPPPPPVWINGAPRSMRSTIAAVDALATPSAPPQGVSSTHVPDGDAFAIGFGGGLITAAIIAAVGWSLVHLTMRGVSPWVVAMVVLALVYVALLLVDRMFPPGRVHRLAVRPIVRTPTEGTKGD